MKFNLLDYGYVTYSGTASMSLEDIADILSGNGTVTISGSGNDSIWIFGDIVDRIGVDEIRYYFDSTTDSGTVASGINFYYKNDEIDSYSSLIINVGPGYYYTTVPGLSSPRYIKLNHDISGTSISGTIVGFEVLNDDSVVDFGADGSLTSSTTLTSLSYLNYNDYIKEIEIYNSGSSIATAYIFIDPQYNDSDELLSISASETGPWVFARNTDYIISNANNWDCGRYTNTTSTGIADGKLRLNSSYTVGTYTTPIFRNDSVKFAYIDMLDTSVSGAIVATDSEDYTSTIQIRSSNTKPLDYHIYRKLYYISGPNKFYYKDFLVSTDTEVYNSYTATGHAFGTSTCTQVYICSSQFTVNLNNQKTAWLGQYKRDYPYKYYIDLVILNHEGITINSKILGYVASYDTFYFTLEVYDMKFDGNDGIWIYFHVADASGGGYAISSAGYYLLHLDSSLNILYNSGPVSSDFISSWDINISDNSIWYSNQIGTQAVIKSTSSGTVSISYENVTGLEGLCSTEDGGCWFIDNNNLYKLNSLGILEDSITSINFNNVTVVARDLEDSNFLWVIDGSYIKLISIDGRVYNSIYIPDFSFKRLLSVSEGVWVFCTESSSGDPYTKFIGKASGGVEKTILCFDGSGECGSYCTDKISDHGINSVSYNALVLGSIIPLSDDPVWNDNLPWNKAVTDNAILPREEYNQLKLTLRRQNISIDSPTVENIYYQNNVEIADISPGQSKTLYLKISIPDGVTIGGDYSSMLRVWWELPAP